MTMDMTPQKLEGLIDKAILLSLCVLIAGLPFSISIVEIAAGIAIALWVFKKAFISRSFKFESTPLNRPILFYLVFALFSIINSQFLMTSLKGFIFKTAEYFLLYFVIVESVKTQKDVRRVVTAILFSCALIGIDGLWQYFSGYDFIRSYPLWSMSRIKASFKFPTGFGGWLITVIPLCITLAIFDTKKKLYKISGIFLSILLLVCLALSLTRGAWFAFVPAIIFLVWKKGDIAKKILLLALAVIILGVGITVAAGGGDLLVLYTIRASAVVHRAELVKLCWLMFKEHPLIGHGINTFMSIYERYAGDSALGGISYAHNCYLQIAVETGAFSLSAFLWMIGALFVSSLKDINKRKEGFVKASQLGFIAGLLAYLVHSAIETNLYSLQLAVLFYYMLGVTMSIQKIRE